MDFFKKYWLIIAAIPVLIFMYYKYRVPPTIEFAQLTTTDLDGNPIDLNQYYGKNIFITMWAPWCGDCRKEMPGLVNLKKNLKNDNFVFLAISGYDIEKEKKYAEEKGYDFQFIHMEEKLKDIGIHSIPTNYIINEKGEIVYEKVGAEDWFSEEVIQKVKELVK